MATSFTRAYLTFALAVMFGSGHSLGQGTMPTRLKDINPLPASSGPSAGITIGGSTFFTAASHAEGLELWRTDGTPEGTGLVKDIRPGGVGSAPQSLTSLGGLLYFTADNGVHGRELWRSDGTAAGTFMVADVYNGPTGAFTGFLQELVTSNDILFLTAFHPTHGRELWTSDGTAAGTALVKDIHPGFGDALSFNTLLVDVAGTLFFTATDGVSGTELWRSDGTAAGTVLVDDLSPGSASSTFNWLHALGSLLVFSRTTADHGTEPWRSDGTPGGTYLLKDIATGAAGSFPASGFGPALSAAARAVSNNFLYFAATDELHGTELWRTDGTTAGTTLVHDVQPGSAGSTPLWLVDLGAMLLFVADDGAHGTELWRSDGSAAGTELIADLASGPFGSFPANLTRVGSAVFFIAQGVAGRELWRTDGTAAGTDLVEDIRPGLGDAFAFHNFTLSDAGGVLFFSADDGIHGVEPWRSNGTSAGTVLLSDILTGTASSSPSAFEGPGALRENEVYFAAGNASSTAPTLWRSTGAVNEATLIADTLVHGPPVEASGVVFFVGSDFATGPELWRTDGTSAGTVLVKDIRPGVSGSFPTQLTNVAGTLFFFANDGSTGTELWKSDGTAAGTVLVKDIRSGGDGSTFGTTISVLGTTALFLADDGVSGRELWRSDGTQTGTTLVKDVAPGPSGSAPPFTAQAVAGEVFYFTANDGVTGSELWRSDGTAAGTTLVKDIYAGAFGSFPYALTDVHGTLFFSAFEAASGTEIWKSDGTAAGTVLVRDIAPGVASSSPSGYTSTAGFTFFVASESASGTELWRTDGTAEGTVLVRDVAPGAASSLPRILTGVGGTVFFSADDGATGRELWSSQGTMATTTRVADIFPGAPSSTPHLIGVANNNLFFYGSDPVAGNEPWVLTLNIPPTISSIASVTTDEDTPSAAVLFVVSDYETAAAALSIHATSSNQTLVPTGNVTLSGTGANRQVQVTPAADQHGVSTITVRVTDGDGNVAATTFVVTVLPVNDPPVISSIPNQLVTAGATSLGPLLFNVTDVDTASASLLVTATSSNQGVVADAAVAIGGSGSNRNVTLVLGPGSVGVTTITLTVSDGAEAAATSFTVTIVDPSPPAPAPPTPLPEIPSAPLDLQATVVGTSIHLRWSAASSLLERLVTPTGYRIEVGRSVGGAEVGIFTTGVTTTFTIGDLVPGTYFLRVRAFNEHGASAPSNEVSVTIAAAPAPGVPRNLQGRVNGRTVNLTWEAPTDASGVVGFVIEAGGSSGGTDSTVTTTGLAFAIDGVADGVFFIRVRAVRAAGLSAPSNEIVLTVGDGMVPCTVPPAAPANLSAVVNGATVTLSWHPSLTGEPPTGFVISVGSAPAIADLGAISIDGAGTSFSATAPNGTFFVRVIAVNRCGASATSNEVTVTVGPEPQLPGAPRNLAATVNGSQVTLIWDPPVTGGPVTQYVIEVVDASGGALLTFQSGNTSTLFVHDGVPAGSYVVHVRAANSALGVGPPSNRVVVIVLP